MSYRPIHPLPEGPGTSTMSLSLVIAGCLAGCGAGAAGASRPPETGAVEEGVVDADPETRRLRAELEALGLVPHGDEPVGFLVEGRAEVHRVSAPPGRCLTLAARSATGLRDLDVTLYAPDGRPLAEDIEPDAHPTVQLCAGPDRPRVAHLLVAALAGHGDYRILAYQGDVETLPEVRRVVGGKPGVALSSSGTPADSERALEEAATRFAAGVERAGFLLRAEPLPLEAPEDGVSFEKPIRVAEGHCYTVALFHPGPPGSVLVTALDGWGTPLARSDPGEGHAALQWCAGESGYHAVRIDGLDQGGRLAVWEVEARRVGGGQDLWLGRPIDPTSDGGSTAAAPDPVARFRRALVARGYPPPRRLGGGRLVTGQAVEGFPTARRRARRGSATGCTAYLAAPGDGLISVDLVSREPEGGVITQARAYGSAGAAKVLVRCGPERSASGLRVSADRGAGGFTLWASERRDEVGGAEPGETLPGRDGLGRLATAELALLGRDPAPDQLLRPERVVLGGPPRPLLSPGDRARCVSAVVLGPRDGPPWRATLAAGAGSDQAALDDGGIDDDAPGRVVARRGRGEAALGACLPPGRAPSGDWTIRLEPLEGGGEAGGRSLEAVVVAAIR